MKVCVFGAGAIGSHVAARLIAAKAADVSMVARGANLEAIRSRGLLIRSNDEEIGARVEVATDDPSSLPPQDLVIVALKTPSLPGAAATLARMLAPRGCALFLSNGIPWWWRYGLPGKAGPLPLLDPQGKLWSELTPQRALGCVVYSPNDPTAPGVIVHRGPNRWVIGEPDNSTTPRLTAAVELLQRGGITAEVSRDLRREMWSKLARNAANNTVSGLIRQPLASASDDPELRRLAGALMRETVAVAGALGWDVRREVDVEKILSQIGAVGAIRSSMLQDVQQHRALEVDALLGQTQAFARETGVPVPTIDVIVPLMRALDKSLALERNTR